MIMNGRMNLRKILSPKRLSHISEQSADDIPHLGMNESSAIKIEVIRRSSSVGNKVRVSTT